MTTALAIGNSGTTTGRVRVYVVAAGNGMATPLVETLTRLGHEVVESTSLEAFAQAAKENEPDLVLVDAAHAAGLPATTSWPVLAIQDENGTAAVPGVLGTLPRNCSHEQLALLARMACEVHQQRVRLQELEQLAQGLHEGTVLVGRSPVLRRLQSAVSRAADCDATVLVEGPAGSGKSLVARMVHCKSRRGHRPVLVANAAELQPEILTAKLQDARGTTLVIEDIDRMPTQAQSVLVRHLKERSPGALGVAGNVPPPRIIATSAAHLPEMVARGAFREDLYYRLHAFPIVVPSLRERPEDTVAIAASILDGCVARSGQRSPGFTPAALVLLESLPWPGNVTQLEGAIRRAHLHAGGGAIDRDHLVGPASGLETTAEVGPRVPTAAKEEAAELTEDDIRPFEQEEQNLLSRALRATRGNVRRAAQLLGIGRATLYRKIQQYHLRLQ